jgi:hypothetical protein
MKISGKSTNLSAGRRASIVSAVGAAVLLGAPLQDGAVAHADPTANTVSDVAAISGRSVPSALPATVQATDGWTMTLAAQNEMVGPAVIAVDDTPPQDFIVSAVFTGSLRGPHGEMTPVPKGSIEAGYQVQCAPGMMSALKPAATTYKVVDESFNDANPSASINEYRVQVDCMGAAVIRSYAILTRKTDSAQTVVAYYGIPVPTVEPSN